MSYASRYDGQTFGYEEERDGYDICYEQMQREECERERVMAEYEAECARLAGKEDV